ncbi:hypothetical protein [Streptomyces chartreusis]
MSHAPVLNSESELLQLLGNVLDLPTASRSPSTSSPPLASTAHAPFTLGRALRGALPLSYA